MSSIPANPALRGLLIALALISIGGCNLLRDATTRLPGPRLYEKGAALIGGLREFEQRIGFTETDNFQDLDHATESYPYCGIVSRYYLPYSYEDPAIRWTDAETEAQCRELAGAESDAYFDLTEAVGEQGTPVTGAMMAGSLVRFVYLVFHEDCHDQFDLPQGIEEPLCNVIAYNAMVAYAGEKEQSTALQRVAMRRYAERESQRTRVARGFYEQLAVLYGRHSRNELSTQALLDERARLIGRAERALAWERGSLNNVGIANDMTYSRHFPYLEQVFDALGRDLARTVAFFRKVDALKPSRASVVKRHGLKNDRGLEFIRAYEEAVLETIRKELQAAAGDTVMKKGSEAVKK
ncbi:MAG TPA: aminopeptidase [Burkholderiales bacterium]|nr:aminopeptidase [Burkholderiales bacterium]